MASAPMIPAIPKTQEIVTKEVLRYHGVNAQAFSAQSNPTSLWRMFVAGQNDVFPYYREVEEKDSAIGSSLEVRKLLVLARDYQVTSADEGNEEAERLKDEASAFLRAIPRFTFALEELLDAPAYGYSVLEIMWLNDGSKVSVERLIGRPQEFFRFGADMLDPQIGDMRFCPNLVPPGIEIPQEKFLVATSRPRHGDRRGLPLLRRLFWLSWFKRQCLRLNLQFAEKGQGTIAVQYASTAGDDEKQKALQAAQAIAEEIAVAVPAGISIVEGVLASSRVRHAEDYQTLIDYLDREMTRMILGQTLSTRGSEEGKGTQALGNVHENLLYEVIKRDAKSLDDVVNEQLLRPWGLWTFGEKFLDRAVRPSFSVNLMPEEDALEQVNFLTKARGLVDISEEEARRRLQIRAPEEGEALIKEAMIPVELTGGGGAPFGGGPDA